MARFDVHRDRDGLLLLDVQADTLPYLKTRLMVPLLPVADAPRPLISILNPVLNFQDGEVAMMTHYAGAVPDSGIGPIQGSLVSAEYEIGRALDMLLTGI